MECLKLEDILICLIVLKEMKLVTQKTFLGSGIYPVAMELHSFFLTTDKLKSYDTKRYAPKYVIPEYTQWVKDRIGNETSAFSCFQSLPFERRVNKK